MTKEMSKTSWPYFGLKLIEFDLCFLKERKLKQKERKTKVTYPIAVSL